MIRGKHARAVPWAVVLGVWTVAALADGTSPASPGRGRNLDGVVPVLHEPIPADPTEDLAMHAAMDGDLPAALMTGAGPVSGPDPRELPSPAVAAYGARAGQADFLPDRDTRHVDGTYDEPFAPSTAPFKRLAAFDGVRPDYQLYVRNPGLTAVLPGSPPEDGEDAFYMDVVVDFATAATARIPSVGPGARIVRGRLGIGAQDVAYGVSRDGADNWFVQARGPSARARARLVMEIAIARSAFGGPMADVSWSEIGPAPPLPQNVAREAAQVSAAIGVSHLMRPRETLAKLAQYFRGFSESEEPPGPHGSVYLDLALSRKGVCRHRAFAFMITALGLGIPTRLAQNEAHAWVEVQDGKRWRRVDLGGAGRLTQVASEQAPAPAYRSPDDSFPWPPGSKRGSDALPGGSGAPGAAVDPARPPALWPSPSPSKAAALSSARVTDSAAADPAVAASAEDDRPASVIALAIADTAARRGSPLHARGQVRAADVPCPDLAVELVLRHSQTQRLTLLGTLATGSDGTFEGSVVVPTSSPLGDYEVVARTTGSARCGRGQN